MSYNSFDTPILILTFNRPSLVAGLLDRLRSVRPSKLYFASDGPRLGNSTDKVNVDECRSLVSSIDWDCEIFSKFSEANLGCRSGVVSAINWFFENEDAGIILEDDCWPEPTFFSYCENLLKLHKHDSNVMSITGYNALGVDHSAGQNYYFSHFGGIWGWATWRRATRRWQRRAPPPRSVARSQRCPTDTTPAWASAAVVSPAARSSAPSSHARCCGMPR